MCASVARMLKKSQKTNEIYFLEAMPNGNTLQMSSRDDERATSSCCVPYPMMGPTSTLATASYSWSMDRTSYHIYAINDEKFICDATFPLVCPSPFHKESGKISFVDKNSFQSLNLILKICSLLVAGCVTISSVPLQCCAHPTHSHTRATLVCVRGMSGMLARNPDEFCSSFLCTDRARHQRVERKLNGFERGNDANFNFKNEKIYVIIISLANPHSSYS